MALFKVMHDIDIWNEIIKLEEYKKFRNKDFYSWRSIAAPVPEIFHFADDTKTVLTEPWQLTIWMMNPGMSGEQFRSLFKKDRAVSDHGSGFGDEPRADYVNMRDLDARPIEIRKKFVFGGAVISGTLNGKILTVDTLDGSKPPPGYQNDKTREGKLYYARLAAMWIMARPHLRYAAITVKPDGTRGTFPQRNGLPVWLPLVVTGTAKAKINTPIWGKPFPYIVEKKNDNK